MLKGKLIAIGPHQVPSIPIKRTGHRGTPAPVAPWPLPEQGLDASQVVRPICFNKQPYHGRLVIVAICYSTLFHYIRNTFGVDAWRLFITASHSKCVRVCTIVVVYAATTNFCCSFLDGAGPGKAQAAALGTLSVFGQN